MKEIFIQNEGERGRMDNITQARHNFVLAFQYCWNGKEFPIFREISVSEGEPIHTGYCAIDLLDEALELHPDFQEARDLRSEIWHAILAYDTRNDYDKYLNSKAWAEIRNKLFEQMGRECICGRIATQVHHKTYANIGKENFLTDLVGLCGKCHESHHQLRSANRTNTAKARAYWNKFKTYVEGNENRLQLFPEPDLLSFYGIRIDRKTLKSGDRHKDGACWLIAYRDSKKLQANLCIQSPSHYNCLRNQQDTIEEEFGDNLGELKWQENKKWIGFFNDTVGHVSTANTDQEFSWLHDRLVRLYAVFQPRVLELQEGT